MRFWVTAMLLVMAGACWGQAAGEWNLFDNGDFADGLSAWSVSQDATCAASIVPGPNAAFPKALRLKLNPNPGSDPWAIALRQPVGASLAKGARVTLRAWIRSPESCRVTGLLELGREPYTKSIHGTVTLSPQWKELSFSGECTQDLAPDQAHAGFHLAHGPGTVEITGIRLVDADAKPYTLGPRPTVAKPLSLIKNGEFTEGLEGNWGGASSDTLKVAVVDADVAGYKRAVRLQSSPPEGAQPWSVGFGQACTGTVRKGDAVFFRAWMRSPDRCRATFIYEMAQAPNTKSISQLVQLTPEWKEYRFVGRSSQTFKPGESQAKWFLGHGKGVVEVAGVRVENFGPARGHKFDQTIDYWGGRDHPDTWRKPALERIEKIRKGDLVVRVLDAGGRPVKDADVSVVQQRHHFRFGSAVPAGRLVDTENPNNVRFQEEVQRLFNTVTFENDLKWPNIRGLATVDKAAEWLKARDIELRGHCLLWGSYKHIAQPTRDLRGPDLLKACREHVAEYTGRMRGKLYLWDVVNEAATNVEVWDNVGWEAFADSFKWARAADPDVKLCYNDYGIVQENPPHRKKVAERIRYLLDHGAPVDVLGIQGHMGTPLTPIHRVLRILDEWAAFGKDLEITEFDLGCPDDKIHGDYVRDFMIAAFSHPRMTAFIQWGFWEGSHWRSKDQAAMFRWDWSKRPAQEAYEDLVFRQWWTRAKGKTGADGILKARAFYGRHEVTVERAGKRQAVTAELLPGQAGEVVVRLE